MTGFGFFNGVQLLFATACHTADMNTTYEKAIMEQQDSDKQVKVVQNTSHWYKFHPHNKDCMYLMLNIVILNDALEKNTNFTYKIVSSDLLLLTDNSTKTLNIS